MNRVIYIQPTHIYAGEPPSGATITCISDIDGNHDNNMFVSRDEVPGLIHLLADTFGLAITMDDGVDA